MTLWCIVHADNASAVMALRDSCLLTSLSDVLPKGAEVLI
jgi:hypothetical protein